MISLCWECASGIGPSYFRGFALTHLGSIPNTAARLQVRVHLLLALGLDDFHPLRWRGLIFCCRRRWPIDEELHLHYLITSSGRLRVNWTLGLMNENLFFRLRVNHWQTFSSIIWIIRKRNITISVSCCHLSTAIASAPDCTLAIRRLSTARARRRWNTPKNAKYSEARNRKENFTRKTLFSLSQLSPLWYSILHFRRPNKLPFHRHGWLFRLRMARWLRNWFLGFTFREIH